MRDQMSADNLVVCLVLSMFMRCICVCVRCQTTKSNNKVEAIVNDTLWRPFALGASLIVATMCLLYVMVVVARTLVAVVVVLVMMLTTCHFMSVLVIIIEGRATWCD